MNLPTLEVETSAVESRHPAHVISRVVRRFAYPAESPFTAITLYFLVLFGVAWAAYHFLPGADAAFTSSRLADMVSSGGSFGETMARGAGGAGSVGFSMQFALLLGAAMIGAVLLMVPPSWVYMATHRAKGLDQNVVQTMLILALSVAGVIVIVRNSLALAFSLAGVVGAVQYRHTLRDPRDTLYVFLAIGVGLAAGVEALPAAAALSLIFCYAILAMSRVDYGLCELGHGSSHLLLTAPRATADSSSHPRKSGGKQVKAFDAVLVVRGAPGAPVQEVVEPFLTAQAKRWQLAQVDTNATNNAAHFSYLLRLGRKANREQFENAVLVAAAPHVIGARIH